jgi:hypothetical protein
MATTEKIIFATVLTRGGGARRVHAHSANWIDLLQGLHCAARAISYGTQADA